jgi:hypothetical protein
MNHKDKENLVNILVNGIDVTEYDFVNSDLIGAKIVGFLNKEYSDMFHWYKNQKVYFSKGEMNGEIFLEIHPDVFLFKMTYGETPADMLGCGHFVLGVLSFLREKRNENLDKPIRKISRDGRYSDIKDYVNKIKGDRK